MNLYAFRETQPADLCTAADPLGSENDRFLEVGRSPSTGGGAEPLKESREQRLFLEAEDAGDSALGFEMCSWLIANDDLNPIQIAGIIIVLSSISAAIISKPAQDASASRGRVEEPAR